MLCGQVRGHLRLDVNGSRWLINGASCLSRSFDRINTRETNQKTASPSTPFPLEKEKKSNGSSSFVCYVNFRRNFLDILFFKSERAMEGEKQQPRVSNAISAFLEVRQTLFLSLSLDFREGRITEESTSGRVGQRPCDNEGTRTLTTTSTKNSSFRNLFRYYYSSNPSFPSGMILIIVPRSGEPKWVPIHHNKRMERAKKKREWNGMM